MAEAPLIGSPTLWDRGTALTSTLHWFETELLTQEENLALLKFVWVTLPGGHGVAAMRGWCNRV